MAIIAAAVVGCATPEAAGLEAFATITVSVDDRLLSVALADTRALTRQGLRGVTDLGSLDGMLFDLGESRAVRFTKRDTLIPLDIYFFDEAGRLVGEFEMTPCESEPCPAYSPDRAVRYALETPAGALDGEVNVLTLGR